MKRLKTLILCLLWTCTISSAQTSLQPDSILTDSAGQITQFCWRVTDQVPEIAKHIVKSRYADSLEVQTDSLIQVLDSTIAMQAVIIELQEIKISNYVEIASTYKKATYYYRQENKKLNRKVKWYKFSSALLVVASFVFVVLR